MCRTKYLSFSSLQKFDFDSARALTGLVTKGLGGSSDWVTAFRVRYSHDGVAWNRITTEDGGGRERVFPGNHDAESENVVYFPRPLRARYLRLTPLTWHGGVGVRAEVLGCDNEYCEFSTSEAIHNTYYCSSPFYLDISSAATVPTVATAPPPIPESCVPCPGVTASDLAGCLCAQGLLWDGEKCVAREQCGCYVDFHRLKNDFT